MTQKATYCSIYASKKTGFLLKSVHPIQLGPPKNLEQPRSRFLNLLIPFRTFLKEQVRNDLKRLKNWLQVPRRRID